MYACANGYSYSRYFGILFMLLSTPTLSGIQFNYLQAQLQAKTVAGFPFTSDNYEHSVALLKERFGQIYKIVNAHSYGLQL